MLNNVNQEFIPLSSNSDTDIKLKLPYISPTITLLADIDIVAGNNNLQIDGMQTGS